MTYRRADRSAPASVRPMSRLRVASRNEPAVQHAPLWNDLSKRSRHRRMDSGRDELRKRVECERGVMRNDSLRSIVMATA